jgi:hypothetical protein
VAHLVLKARVPIGELVEQPAIRLGQVVQLLGCPAALVDVRQGVPEGGSMAAAQIQRVL